MFAELITSGLEGSVTLAGSCYRGFEPETGSCYNFGANPENGWCIRYGIVPG